MPLPHAAVFLILFFAMFPLSAEATEDQHATVLVSFSKDKAEAGTTMHSVVYFHNEGQTAIDIDIPHQAQVVITSENSPGQQINAFLTEGQKTVTLAPGSFYKCRYTFDLPPESRGKIYLSLADFPGSGGMVSVDQATDKSHVALASPPPAREEKKEQYPVIDSFAQLYQSYASNFSSHKPIYFLVGSEPDKSKFQISFRYRPFNPDSSLAREYQWLSGLHLAYTQTSFWDLSSKSLPFSDTSYKPQLLYLSRNLQLRPAWLNGLYLESGVQHESNGRDGEESRGTNTAYVRPIAILYNETNQLGLSVSPTLRTYFKTELNNSDIADYRGYFELETAVGKAHDYMLTTALRFAQEGTSFQADFTYPLHRLFADSLDLYLVIQYVNSLAEDLIDYRERTETVSFGFALTR